LGYRGRRLRSAYSLSTASGLCARNTSPGTREGSGRKGGGGGASTLWPQPSKPYSTRWRRSRARGGCACWALGSRPPTCPTPRYSHAAVLWPSFPPRRALLPRALAGIAWAWTPGRGIADSMRDAESRSPLRPNAGDGGLGPGPRPPGRGCVPTSRRELWSWARPEGRTTDGSGRGGGVLDHRRPEGAAAAVGRWVRAGAVACGVVAANFGRQVR
jgi:hypothetical protein